MNISKLIGGNGDIRLNRLYVLIICSLFLFLDKERDIIMELLQLVEKFKNVFSIEKLKMLLMN